MKKKRMTCVWAIMFLLCSCNAQKTVISENAQESRFVGVNKMVSDSTVYRQRSEVKIETVKADTVRLKLNPVDIAKLPTGASFNQKSGRATIAIRQIDNGNMDIIAICDSLTIFYESLTVEYEHYRKMSNDSIDSLNKEIVKIKSQSVKDSFWDKIRKIVIVIVGIALFFLIIKK